MENIDLITVLGPTASGKTAFASHLAHNFDGEIISADSRQVYRGMTIGTGKDYKDYEVEGKVIPCHLLDIADAGYKYNVFEFQKDFLSVYQNIKDRGKLPVLCGGSGMYIEAITNGYTLIQVPENRELRKKIEKLSMEELTAMLASYKNLHNTTDTVNRKRITRALEIEVFYKEHPGEIIEFPSIKTIIIGIKYDRPAQRRRISDRLQQRIKEGMIEEVELLLKHLSPEQLTYYGLEYKFITKHIIGELSYDEMVKKLETAIHQFAKRQMTWFRKMERNGTIIHWIDGHMRMEEKMERALSIITKNF
ncbi:MAG: tRNA (adenosine(37)-N6)-dimethylallyltransferase MiaA [Bacteroidales bacterium]|nr:tRNA (adenosine(37)-N6)-dimethylallyltransferase MiaA [Bacteroidales bacterium]